jgi:hypothetical protein
MFTKLLSKFVLKILLRKIVVRAIFDNANNEAIKNNLPMKILKNL